MNFPKIPNSKVYHGNTTPEQDAQMKLLQGIDLDEGNLRALEESVTFYEQAYPFLKEINLSEITESDKNELIVFLDKVLNYQLVLQNNLRFKTVFRVSFVRDSFLDNEKVRETKFISYPPADIVKSIGRYGRANSPDSTCLYCAFNPIIALLETKPKVGDRIIISQWQKDDDLPFVSFPIANNETIKNKGVEKATKAFKERMTYNHPLFARTLDLFFDFLSSEFIKEVPIQSPNAYEYLYSAYFADITLISTIEPVEHPTEPINDYDCLIYPSVASKHKTDNIAVKPSSVKRLRPIFLQELIIKATDYENAKIYENEFPEVIDLPIVADVLRTSNIIRDDQIIWSDD